MYHMLQNYTTYKILRLFFDYPTKGFQLREISRLTKLGMPSVSLHIKRLEKYGFIKKEKTGVYANYKASRNDLFMLYKRNDMLLRLHECGLVEFLADKFLTDVIVLFGSASRGEDIETSDIDILIISKEEEVNMKKYENILKRKINILFERRTDKIPKELLNNIINGMVIYGYLKVF